MSKKKGIEKVLLNRTVRIDAQGRILSGYEMQRNKLIPTAVDIANKKIIQDFKKGKVTDLESASYTVSRYFLDAMDHLAVYNAFRFSLMQKKSQKSWVV